MKKPKPVRIEYHADGTKTFHVDSDAAHAASMLDYPGASRTRAGPLVGWVPCPESSRLSHRQGSPVRGLRSWQHH